MIVDYDLVLFICGMSNELLFLTLLYSAYNDIEWFLFAESDLSESLSGFFEHTFWERGAKFDILWHTHAFLDLYEVNHVLYRSALTKEPPHQTWAVWTANLQCCNGVWVSAGWRFRRDYDAADLCISAWLNHRSCQFWIVLIACHQSHLLVCHILLGTTTSWSCCSTTSTKTDTLALEGLECRLLICLLLLPSPASVQNLADHAATVITTCSTATSSTPIFRFKCFHRLFEGCLELHLVGSSEI